MSPVQSTLLVERDDHTGRLRLRVDGSRLVLAAGLLFLGVMLFALATMAWRLALNYASYEGTVVEIRRDWLSACFGDEGFPERRITLETADGRRLTRFASDYALALNRIAVGDLVRKERGFFARPRAVGKKTTGELLRELEETLEKHR